MKIFVFAVLVLIAQAACGQGVAPTEVLENVQKHYSTLNDATANFAQKVSFKYA